MQTLISWDKAVFKFINSGLSNPVFDAIMPLLRISWIWAPVYMFMLAFALVNFKKAGWWILFAVLTVSFTDYVSSSVLKPNFDRLRPFANPDIAGTVKVLVHSRPGNASFPSSHAANHFGLATFIFFTLKPLYGNLMFWFFAWAFVICLAQVYVGVHFPGDVIAGGLFGFVFGYLPAKAFNRRFSLNNAPA